MFQNILNDNINIGYKPPKIQVIVEYEDQIKTIVWERPTELELDFRFTDRFNEFPGTVINVVGNYKISTRKKKEIVDEE